MTDTDFDMADRVAIFDSPWCAGIIERFSPPPDAEGYAQARCALVAACILAESIDRLAAAITKADSGLADAIGELAVEIGPREHAASNGAAAPPTTKKTKASRKARAL